LEKAVKEVERLWGKQHELYTGLLEVLAGVRGRLGRYDDAEQLLGEAYGIEEATYGPDHLRMAVVLHNLGILSDWRGRYTEAVDLFLKSLSIKEKTVERDDPELTSTLQALADIYEKLNEPAKARAYQERLKKLPGEKQE
jgi:tetratricopeptide (TPR) repeat protein